MCRKTRTNPFPYIHKWLGSTLTHGKRLADNGNDTTIMYLNVWFCRRSTKNYHLPFIEVARIPSPSRESFFSRRPRESRMTYFCVLRHGVLVEFGSKNLELFFNHIHVDDKSMILKEKGLENVVVLVTKEISFRQQLCGTKQHGASCTQDFLYRVPYWKKRRKNTATDGKRKTELVHQWFSRWTVRPAKPGGKFESKKAREHARDRRDKTTKMTPHQRESKQQRRPTELVVVVNARIPHCFWIDCEEIHQLNQLFL